LSVLARHQFGGHFLWVHFGLRLVVSVLAQAIRGLELVIIAVNPGMAGGAAGACIVVVCLQCKHDKGKPVSHVRFLFSALRRLRTRRIAARQVFSRS
jgi:hypothetical protein